MFAFLKTVPLTPERRKKAELSTICSACCTAMGDVPFVDAAIIILYANMMGASDMFSMITTSLSPLAVGFFSLLATMISGKQRYQTTIIEVTAISLLLFGMIVAAPCFGSWSVAVLIAALSLFAICHTIYISAWFPLLSTFLDQDTRGSYLGKMRFCWQLSSALLLFVIGLLIGKNPPIWYLQLAMFASMCIFACKMFFIAQVPTFEKPETKTVSFGFAEGLRKAVENKPLTGFSSYIFILNLAAYGTIPLTTLYMKKGLHVPDNIIVLVSSISLGGMLVGSFCSGTIIRKFGIRTTLLFIHATYALSNLILFTLSRDLMTDTVLYLTICAVLFTYCFTFACSDIATSCEMMELATPGNKVVAMSFCNAFNFSGRGLSRLLSSLILGSGALAETWFIGSMSITHYQTLFLVYSVCVVFAASLLVVVPAIFPKGEYVYSIHH